jgi:hypothetical protein
MQNQNNAARFVRKEKGHAIGTRKAGEERARSPSIPVRDFTFADSEEQGSACTSSDLMKSGALRFDSPLSSPSWCFASMASAAIAHEQR